MIFNLNEKELETLDLFLRLINNLGYSYTLHFKSCLNSLIYYSSRLKIFDYLFNSYAYYKFMKYLESIKIYLIWHKFSEKDYWLFLDYIITYVSDFIIDDFLDILSIN